MKIFLSAVSAQFKASGKHWTLFDDLDQLCRLVLRNGWQQMGSSPDEVRVQLEALGERFGVRLVG